MLMVAYNALRKPKICHHAARRSVRTCHAHLGSSCTTRCFQPQKHAERHVQREQEHNSHPGEALQGMNMCCVLQRLQEPVTNCK